MKSDFALRLPSCAHFIMSKSGDVGNDWEQLAALRGRVLRKLVDAVNSAAKVEVVGAKSDKRGGLELSLLIDETSISISALAIEVVEGDLEEAARKVKGLRGRYNRVKKPEFLTLKELQDRNLPLYWNEEWLRAELDRLGSYAEIARVHGYPSPVTIASYGKRKFGIDIQGKFDEKREAVYRDFDSGDYTQLQLAEMHDVGVATVYRWLKERRKGKETASRRGSASTRIASGRRAD